MLVPFTLQHALAVHLKSHAEKIRGFQEVLSEFQKEVEEKISETIQKNGFSKETTVSVEVHGGYGPSKLYDGLRVSFLVEELEARFPGWDITLVEDQRVMVSTLVVTFRPNPQAYAAMKDRSQEV
jgi:hypothetical protein